MAHNAGKGSGRRPNQVPDEVVANNWEQIFGKKKPKHEQPQEQQSSDVKKD